MRNRHLKTDVQMSLNQIVSGKASSLVSQIFNSTRWQKHSYLYWSLGFEQKVSFQVGPICSKLARFKKETKRIVFSKMR